MRTNPFNDIGLFLVGAQGDQLALGLWRWPFVILFSALLAGSVWIAREAWMRHPSQRRAAHVWTWLFRVVMGCMWFQGSLWKLPFPVSDGFRSWTEQLFEHAAFQIHRDIVRDWLLPNIALLQPLVFLTEVAMAASLILGVLVRWSSLVGIAFALQLWLGLYHHPAEWPWLFWFMVLALGQFAVRDAGRSLGLDTLRRGPPDEAVPAGRR